MDSRVALAPLNGGRRTKFWLWMALLSCGPFALLAQNAGGLRLVSAFDPKFVLVTGHGGDSTGPVLSTDGSMVAFTSSAANLVTNTHTDQALNVYLRDRKTGTTLLVSASADGASGGDQHSVAPSLSGDGRYVVFESRAQNLVTNVTYGVGDIYVRDLAAGITKLVSVATNGLGGNRASTAANITPDGRFVVFESLANNLTTKDTNANTDIYLRDLLLETTTLVSLDWRGKASAIQASSGSSLVVSLAPTVTPDGRHVLFQSYATNVIKTGTPANYAQVFVRDLQLGTNYLASAKPPGPAATISTGPLDVSEDGRYVLFRSISSPSILYRRDLQATSSVAIASNRVGQIEAWMAPDGQQVVYAADRQVYLWEGGIGESRLMTTNGLGEPSSGNAFSPVLSRDGRNLAFLSDATDLAPQATNGRAQVYFRDMITGQTTLASATQHAPAGSASDCEGLCLSEDGGVVAFQSEDGDLVDGDDNGTMDVFVRQASLAEAEAVSVGDPALPPTAPNMPATLAPSGISADGRYILFTSSAKGLTPFSSDGLENVYVRDAQLGTSLLVSMNQTGTGGGNGASQLPVLTPDGRFAAFVSAASDLVEGDTNQIADVFVRDLAKQTTALASVRPEQLAKSALAPGVAPVISDDGRYTAWAMGRAILVRDLQLQRTIEVTNWMGTAGLDVIAITGGRDLWYRCPAAPVLEQPNFYRYDLGSGALEPIAVAATRPAVTSDGRFCAIQAFSSLNPGVSRYARDQNELQPLFPSFGAVISESEQAVCISEDGRLIAFPSPSNRTASADTNNATDVYLVDAGQPDTVMLVSVNQAGTSAGNRASGSPNISGDGRYVAFQSLATDLVAGAMSGRGNVYIRDLKTGTTLATQVDDSGQEIHGFSFNAHFDATVSTLFLESSLSTPASSHPSLLPQVYAFALPNEPGIRVNLLPLVTGANPTLLWEGQPGKSYRVQFKNRLEDLAWTDAPDAPVEQGAGQLRFEDKSLNGAAQRYYRVVMFP